MQTIDEIMSFLKGKDVNLRNISMETGIPYDRIAAWRLGRGKPKTEDTQILMEWAKKKTKTANKMEEVQTNGNGNDTRELINALKKNVELLEKNINGQEERIKSLLSINSNLKDAVQANLKTVLDNQLTLTCLFESYLKSFASLMIEEPAQQQAFRLQLHKAAFVQVKDLIGRGKHVEIDNDDIISSEA